METGETLSPFFAKSIKAGTHQVIGSHGDFELYCGIERQKPRLSQNRYFGRIIKVYDKHGTPQAILFREIH